MAGRGCPKCLDLFVDTAIQPLKAGIGAATSARTDLAGASNGAYAAGNALQWTSNQVDAMVQAGATDPEEGADAAAAYGTAATLAVSMGGYLTTAAEWAGSNTPILAVGALDISLAYAVYVEAKAAMNGQCSP
jgi:hypothetical protein